MQMIQMSMRQLHLSHWQQALTDLNLVLNAQNPNKNNNKKLKKTKKKQMHALHKGRCVHIQYVL